MLGGLTPAHLIVILIIALIVIGPGKLPEVGAAIGKSVREFQKASGGITDVLSGTTAQPAPPPQAPQLMQPQPPAQPYYPVPAGYAAPAQPAPIQYQPVMGVIEPAPAAPAQPAPAAPAQPAPAAPAQPAPAAPVQPDPVVPQPPIPPSVG